MGKSRRRTEKWFNRLLWLISVIFAAFLIGLGGKIISDLPLMSEPLHPETFYQTDEYQVLGETLDEKLTERTDLAVMGEQLSEKLALEKLTYDNERDVFENWLKTREATLDPLRDPALITRTESLETMKQNLSELEKTVSENRSERQALSVVIGQLENQRYQIEQAGYERFYFALEKQQLQEFLIRLAITLPLLLVAIWLFVKRRNGKFWPFSWGFIFFALFAFFFELVPYLPSYGGYVRFAVGILLTFGGGYYAIRAFNRYRERQKVEESVSDEERRKMLGYNFVLQRIDKSLCPSCERGINYRNPAIDFCPHCGITLFKRCPSCHVRKNAFLNYCASCGTKEVESIQGE